MKTFKKIAFYLLLLLVILFLFRKCEPSEDLKAEIQSLQKEKDSIENVNIWIKYKNDSLKTQHDIDKSKINAFEQRKDSIVYQRVVIREKVEKMQENELDSVINSKPKKQTVQILLDYPLLQKQNNFLDSINKYQKRSLLRLEKVIEYKDALIINKDKQIEIVEKQRDLYKEALKPKSQLYLYGRNAINNFNTPELGAAYNFKNKVLITVTGQYNNLTNNTEAKIGIGIPILKNKK